MIEVEGAWDGARARRFLETTRIPVRLAVARPGRAPRLLSLWYLWHEEALWCATQRGAAVVKALGSDPHCAFEVAPDDPPYRGVRGVGRARVEPARGAEVLDRLLTRYRVDRSSGFAAWLWSRREDEVALRIAPGTLFTWDFAARMGDAVPPPDAR